MTKEFRCRHFTGVIHNKTCNAGIAYDSVRDESDRPYKWPCIHPDASTSCASFMPYTPEELAEQNRLVENFLENMAAFEARETEACIQCGKHVDRLDKVGRCVYARPCNCRLWQGAVPDAWKG